MSHRKTGYSSINVKTAVVSLMLSCLHMRMKNKHSALSICFLFYDFNHNTQGIAYLETVKHQPGLHRNVHVFAKCNVCVSAIQLFYIHTYPGFLPISKYIRLSLSRIPKDSIKYFEISVPRHIRFAELRKKLFEQPH